MTPPKTVTGYFFTAMLVEKNHSRPNQNQNLTQGEPNFQENLKILIKDQHPEKQETQRGTAFFNLFQSSL